MVSISNHPALRDLKITEMELTYPAIRKETKSLREERGSTGER